MTGSAFPQFKTVSEQRLEWLESLRRPLTDDESEILRRAMIAVYSCPRQRAARARKREAV